jgi:hypothetical protein
LFQKKKKAIEHFTSAGDYFKNEDAVSTANQCYLRAGDVCIRQHTSAYVSIRQHTSAYVSIRQHTSAYVSIRQHTSAYVCCEHRQPVLPPRR